MSCAELRCSLVRSDTCEPMTIKSGTMMIARFHRRATAALAGVLLVGLVAFGATPAQAQVQIDQVEPVASQIGGATQGQLVVTLPGDCTPSDATCENVSRSDVLGLIPGGTPSLSSYGSGNSAVILQRGDDNDATVEQQGSSNEASITQLKGSDNEATVEQGPSTKYPGLNNLAVIVQKGSMNQTTTRQRGRDNLAGIRLVGSNNGIRLVQTGSRNEYLLDFTGSNLGSMGSSTTHQVSQIGSNNRLVQVGEGRMPFNVRQRGDGMRMIIRHTPE